ncbi:MAG: amidohydrolase family protein [Sphingomonadaceae bacterium]|nr:amidohydrolase family protein [Sphingomonadaceae bacterium]
MFDTVIRGGTIVDGTGGGTFAADIAIADGKIVEIGKVDGQARRSIDADGAVVTPGFIDIHTHYDGQLIWDNELEPSFSNGTTTAIAGNCGVGFAPAKEELRKPLIELMEGVEDIPGIVLDEGLDWKWNSFPDYLERVAQKDYTMDVAVHLPHAPVRVFVMGERALNHEPATPEDIEAMKQHVRASMAAGAIGVSGSRILEHKSSTGEHVPGTFAEEAEMLGLASAMGESGRGVFQVVPLGAGGDSAGTPASWEERIGEHRRIERIAEASGRPVTYLLHSYDHAPEEYAKLIAESERACARGLDIVPQVAARGLGLLLGLDALNPFLAKPSYKEIAHLARSERAMAMRDPGRRQRILTETGDGADPALERRIANFCGALGNYFVLDSDLDYEPDESRRLDVIAARTGRTMEEVVYDTITEGDGLCKIVKFVMNYTNGGLDSAYEMLRSPATVSGLGDGGAHLQLICDSAMTTFHLSFWCRDRQRGPKIPVETMVHKLTGKPAGLYGLSDRGTIAVGKRADLNIIDFDNIGNQMPEMYFDLPKGGGRMLQYGRGYLATLVAGTFTRENDQSTGAHPGRLVRSMT